MNTNINTASSSVRVRSILGANLLLALAMILWASGFPAAEVLLEVWDPLTLNSTRYFLTLILLVPLWIVLDGFRSFLDASWLKGMTIGGIGFGLGTYLILKAQVLSDPVIVSIVVVSTPAIATGLEVLLDKRRLKKVFVSGVTLAILGGAIAVWDNSRVETVGLGAFVAFVACIFFAWGSRAAVKMLPDLTLTGQTSITAIGAFVFSVSISIFGYLLGHQKIPTSINIIETLPELLIYSIFAFTISQLLWIGGIRKVGIAVASIHFNFVPFYVMFSLVLLGGSWSWVSVIGTAVVVAGVLLANRKT